MKIEVNGLTVPEVVIDREIIRLKQAEPKRSEEEIKKTVEQHLIRQALLREAAHRADKPVSVEEVEAAYRNFIGGFGGEENFLQQNNLKQEQVPMVKNDIALNLKVEKFLEDLTKNVLLPRDEKLKEYYDANPRLKKAPPSTSASHILKQPGPGVYEAMCDIRQKLMDGADFAETATECSDSREPEGKLGFFPRGNMVPEFDDIVFSMNVGEISPVFRSPYGYHIVKVTDKKPAHDTTFEEVKERVKTEVMGKMREIVVNEWLDKQIKSAKITVTQ